MAYQFDVKKMLSDLGGVSEVSRSMSLSRTTPYRWISQGHMTTRVLGRIKDLHPTINFNRYFRQE